LLDRAGPARPALFDPWLDLALLDGEEGRPCRVLAARPRLSDSYAKRVYCTARAGEWATAAVIYDSAVALDLLSDRQADLLAQFLDPETVGRSPGLAPPQEVTPLLFRLYEAAGSPLPTGNLPRAFAVADLRPTAGWKVRLDAAERLARTGALPANRLLGLYTEREPPASGGVWERAAAVQALDKALSKNDAETVARVLPGAWADMRRQNLATPFAEIFGTRLARIALEGPARAAAFRAALLSPEYEAAIAAFVPQTRAERFLAGLARGTPPAQAARTPLEKAIAAAFAASGPAPAQAPLLEAGKLGQAILAAGHQIDTAAPGQVARIRAGLQTLLAVGLEDTARRAALQLLILPART
jgi:hypothetical protein